MALHNLYETTNFVVSCEDRDVPGVLENVLKRASPLKGSFEFDFQDLGGLFGATNRFGDAGNKIQVVLDAILEAKRRITIKGL